MKIVRGSLVPAKSSGDDLWSLRGTGSYGLSAALGSTSRTLLGRRPAGPGIDFANAVSAKSPLLRIAYAHLKTYEAHRRRETAVMKPGVGEDAARAGSGNAGHIPRASTFRAGADNAITRPTANSPRGAARSRRASGCRCLAPLPRQPPIGY